LHGSRTLSRRLDAFSDSARSDPEHRNKRTATGTSSTFSSGKGNDVFGSKNGENDNNHGPRSGVPDRNGPLRKEYENNPSVPRFEGPAPLTVAHNSDDTGESPIVTVRANPLKSNGRSTADEADANHPPKSDSAKMDAAGWRGRI
jgi:hypothetical protein